MAVVMELGSGGWRSRGKEFVVQMHQSSHSSSNKSADSSSTSGASGEVLAMAAALPGKKRGWGQDLHKAVQLMLGQVQVPETLDLLGISNARHPQQQQPQQQAEFLELDPNWTVPEGWEKCLDLRSGAVYYQNRSTGAKTFVDPRQQQRPAPAPATPSSRDGDPGGSDSAPTTPVNFLTGSKPASSSASPPDGSLCLGSCVSAEMAAPAPWALEHWAAAARGFSERIPQQDLLRFRSPGHGQKQGLEDNSGLDLKLSSCSAEPRFLKDDGKSVCTMEKVREALLRDKRPPPSPSPSLPLPQQQQQHGALPWSRSPQPLLNLRSPPASPSDSSSSASSSTPPSDGPAASPAGRRKRESGSRQSSPKNVVAAASCCHRAGSPSGPNCVSSSSNVSSSPNHPSSGSICPVDSSSNLACSSTHISPNLASLKLSSPLLGGGSPFRADMEGSGHLQDLGLGLGSGSPSPPAVTLKCCKNCLIYVMLSKEEMQCPRCHNSGLLDFSSTAPGPSSFPATKKPKLEMVEL